MSSSNNDNPNTSKSQESDKLVPEKVVMQDECGDSLWDEVLAQYPDLTTVISKETKPEPDQE